MNFGSVNEIKLVIGFIIYLNFLNIPRIEYKFPKNVLCSSETFKLEISNL